MKWEQAPEQGSKVFFRVLNEEQWQSVSTVKENKENIVEIKKLESGKVYEVSVAATVVVGEKTFESRHVKRFVRKLIRSLFDLFAAHVWSSHLLLQSILLPEERYNCPASKGIP